MSKIMEQMRRSRQYSHQINRQKQQKCLHKYKSITIFDNPDRTIFEDIYVYFKERVQCEFYFTIFLTLLYILMDKLFLGGYLLQVSNTQLKLIIKRQNYNSTVAACNIIQFIGGADFQISILFVVFFTFPLSQIKFLTFSTYIFSCRFWIQALKVIYGAPRPYYYQNDIGLSCELGYGKPSEHSYLPLLCMIIYYYENQIYQKEKEILIDKSNFVVNDSIDQQTCKDPYYLLMILILILHGCICWSRLYMGMQSLDSVVLGTILSASSASLYIFGFRELTIQAIQYLSDYFIGKQQIQDIFDKYIKNKMYNHAQEKKFDVVTDLLNYVRKYPSSKYEACRNHLESNLKDYYFDKPSDVYVLELQKELQQMALFPRRTQEMEQTQQFLQQYYQEIKSAQNQQNSQPIRANALQSINRNEIDMEFQEDKNVPVRSQEQIVFFTVLGMVLIPLLITIAYALAIKHQNKGDVKSIIRSQKSCYKRLYNNDMHDEKYFLRYGLISQSYMNMIYIIFYMILLLGVFLRAKIESCFDMDMTTEMIDGIVTTMQSQHKKLEHLQQKTHKKLRFEKDRYKKSVEWYNYAKMLLVFVFCELIFLVPINGIMIPLNLYLITTPYVTVPVIFQFYYTMTNIVVFYLVYFTLFEMIVSGIYIDEDISAENRLFQVPCLGWIAIRFCRTLYYGRNIYRQMYSDHHHLNSSNQLNTSQYSNGRRHKDNSFIPQNRYFSYSRQEVHFEIVQMLYHQEFTHKGMVNS